MLMELIVAISVLTIGFLGFLSLLSRSLSLTSVIADNFTANYLAMEGIEVTKNLIDANYIARAASGGSSPAWNQGIVDGCYQLDYTTQKIGNPVSCVPAAPINFDGTFYGYAGGTATRFYRVIKITNIVINGNADEIKVNSTVSYVGRGSVHYKIDMEDHFFAWKP